MKPTIGRIVFYKVNPHFDGPCNGVTELPAIVTRVWSDTCVNLRVFSDGDCSDFSRTSRVEGDNWRWPPRDGDMSAFKDTRGDK